MEITSSKNASLSSYQNMKILIKGHSQQLQKPKHHPTPSSLHVPNLKSTADKTIMTPASWHNLPPELHIAIVHLLPTHTTLALSKTSWASRSLCVPEIFADVKLLSARALHAFSRHVPKQYGSYIKSLSVCTKPASSLVHGEEFACTDALVNILESTTRLQSLSLSLATSLNAEKAISAFGRLINVHTFEISCWGREDEAPVSERLAVSLAASLPSLSHLSLSHITRSAMHVDPCEVPYEVPIVMNDFEIPPHPVLGSDLALPSLLRLPSLHTLEIRDTWLGCDTKIEFEGSSAPHAALQKLLLTGSMYSADAIREGEACTAWLRACGASLRTLELGSSLVMPQEQTPLPQRLLAAQRAAQLKLPHVSHVHINASRVLVDDLSSTLDVLSSCGVKSISIAYEDENQGSECTSEKRSASEDNFARQCALDDLEDWREAIDTYLLHRSQADWNALQCMNVSFAKDVQASWDL
ncbi:hypothetical protein HYDPIDRAFT_113728 [Hydnomerulius pinastri MD-312]|uniref:F-box domain-containing protein n=1 Tax=Hydnomerulius pinastri MD-312 TaxID=994086 RepID=A0A0C9VBZ9_9AGAM|nr:hypothetical protein HYDPIDRAFT_113728 [Hydnomerulius pinastri MD-312]